MGFALRKSIKASLTSLGIFIGLHRGSGTFLATALQALEKLQPPFTQITPNLMAFTSFNHRFISRSLV